MGLGVSDVRAIAKLKREGNFSPRPTVVEIGAQQMSGQLFEDTDWIGQCVEAFGILERRFHGSRGVFLATGQRAQSPDAPPARDLWEWLGFTYRSVDLDGSPDAIPLDLNVDGVPADMIGTADLVTNCGTTEHIINQLNAMKAIHDLTKPGGIMLHNVPSQGYMTHGLVNYPPKFFWALSAANGYEWLAFDLMQVPVTYPTPDSVVDELRKYSSTPERAADYRFADAGLLVIMRKKFDLPFVAPIDVRPGSETANPVLSERYWTIFQAPRFHALIAEIEAKRAHEAEAQNPPSFARKVVLWLRWKLILLLGLDR